MEIVKTLEKLIREAVEGCGLDTPSNIRFEHPANPEHGDYATTIAHDISAQQKEQEIEPQAKKRNPQELAQMIAKKIEPKIKTVSKVDRVEAKSGFINFFLSDYYFVGQLERVLKKGDKFGFSAGNKGKKYMVEYAHPNTHKEMHIGHMRTLITGESLARILAATGAGVFRANYQGDIGPHVAKSIWGTQRILTRQNMDWDQAEKLGLAEKARLLGKGYVLGNRQYDEYKSEIDKINKQLYLKEAGIWPVYNRTRQWSLDYYDAIYRRFGTQFDRLYFESEVSEPGKGIVLESLSTIFKESDGAIIFDGEPYGLHKRVFITAEGHPTYEAKDMGLAPLQFSDFEFDLNIHVVASEQKGYFEVVFKALELVDPRFEGREYHLSMGMVQLKDRKISSRTGVVITVDGLLEEVKSLMRTLVVNDNLSADEVEQVVETAGLAAVKYSVLRSGPTLDVAFDLGQSVSLEGDSGPYLQYTYARARSLLRKAGKPVETSTQEDVLSDSEREVLRVVHCFPEVVEKAAGRYAPNLICSYLFNLAQAFNRFYEKERVIGSEKEGFRLTLSAGVAQVLKNGLYLLGIGVVERM